MLSLSTKSFLLNLICFIARWGKSKVIYTDNGRNYQNWKYSIIFGLVYWTRNLCSKEEVHLTCTLIRCVLGKDGANGQETSQTFSEKYLYCIKKWLASCVIMKPLWTQDLSYTYIKIPIIVFYLFHLCLCKISCSESSRLKTN